MEFNMLRLALFTILVLIGSTSAALATCGDEESQQDINQCAYAEFEAADAELNAAYQELLAKIDENYVPALRAAQRAWLPLRDAECEFESMGWEGGSGRPMIQSACLKRMTEERTKLLHVFLACDPEAADAGVECPAKR